MTTATTFDSDRMIEIFGVKGRLTHRTRKPGQAAQLWFKQRIVTESRKINEGEYKGYFIKAEIRFDDECGNRHNTFAITGEINERQSFAERTFVAGGCLHEEIAKHFPELAHLIKWHLCSTDSPMHYVANTVYHASDRDHTGKRKGEVTRTETRLKFHGFPITYQPKGVLKAWLIERGQNIPEFEKLVTPVEHANKPGEYAFSPKYTFAGCNACKWHEAPFDTVRDAEEFAAALALGFEWVTIPTAYSEGKARDFDAARACGVWPDATDEQLSVEPEELKAALLERLPALIAAMRHDIEQAGFIWSADEFN